MTVTEYLTIRLRNGYICENCAINDVGVAVYRSPNPIVKTRYPNDFDYIHRCENTSTKVECNTMEDFWDKAITQKALLWALRGLGGKYYELADIVWSDLVNVFGVSNHVKITPEDSLAYAHCVRMRVGHNPFKGI